MKFKVDENLPVEAAEILRKYGLAADTVGDEYLSGSDDEVIASRSRSEDRILVTLDLDFANIRAYPPGTHGGVVVFRLKRQDKATVLAYVRRLAAVLPHRSPVGELWIIRLSTSTCRQLSSMLVTAWPRSAVPRVRLPSGCRPPDKRVLRYCMIGDLCGGIGKCQATFDVSEPVSECSYVLRRYQAPGLPA